MSDAPELQAYKQQYGCAAVMARGLLLAVLAIDLALMKTLAADCDQILAAAAMIGGIVKLQTIYAGFPRL